MVGLTALSLNIVLTRSLGVTRFGLFAIAASVLLVASNIADFGMGTSLVRYVSLYRQQDGDLTRNLMAVAFRLMLMASLLVALGILIAAGPVASFLSNDKALAGLLRIVALGVFGTAATAAILSVLQAQEYFKRYALINLVTAAAKFVLIIFLLIQGLLTLTSVVFVYALVPILTLIFGLVVFRQSIPRFFSGLQVPRQVIANYLHFGKWVIISFLAVSVMTRVDIFMLAIFENSRTVGLYAAALQLSMVVYTLIGSLVRVILPKVSKLTKKEEYQAFIKKALKFAVIGCLLLSPLLLFSKQIILIVYGQEYAGSVGLFQLLFFTFLLIPTFQPVTMVIYALGKPFIMTMTHVAQFAVSIVSNLILIPIYGGYGAAVTLLVINVLGTGFLLGYIFYTVNRSDEIIVKEELEFNV